MRYRIKLYGRWEVPLVPPSGDGKYQFFPPLVLEAGEYEAEVAYQPYPFGDRNKPYLILSQDGQRGGFTIDVWKLWQHDFHGDKRVEVICLD